MWDCNVELSSLVPFDDDSSPKKAKVDDEELEDDGPDEPTENSKESDQEKITEFVEEDVQVQERDEQGKVTNLSLKMDLYII